METIDRARRWTAALALGVCGFAASDSATAHAAKSGSAFVAASLKLPVAVQPGGATLVQGAAAAAPLRVVAASPDASGDTVTVTGANFGARPLVTLDLRPLTIRYAVASQIVVAVPVAMMPPGEYLLTVSRGAGADESASIVLTLPAAGAPRPPTSSASGSGTTRASAAAASPTPAPAMPSGADIAATIGATALRIADVDQEWARTDPAGYLAVQRRLYEERRRVLDRVVADRLLAAEAASRGVTVDALLADEIPKRTIAMPDSAVTAIYQGLGDQTRGASLEQLRPAIRAWLAKHTEPELARLGLVDELMKVSTKVDVALVAPRVDLVSAPTDAVLGPAAAPITIVVFGDFESQGYAALATSFGRVRDTFGDRVRIVFKHLPTLGPESELIAQAAACAQRQDRFWPYHDAVITVPGPFDTNRLKQLARSAGVTMAPFEACVDGGDTAIAIREALNEAAGYGVDQSPSVMVNGRLAPPPPPFLPPFEFVKRLIEEALQMQAKDAATRR